MAFSPNHGVDEVSMDAASRLSGNLSTKTSMAFASAYRARGRWKANNAGRGALNGEKRMIQALEVIEGRKVGG